MKSRLQLSQNIPVNSLKIRRYIEKPSSHFIFWRIFPFPCKISLKPEVTERAPGLSRIDFQVFFSLPFAPLWFLIHNRFLKTRINYFIQKIYFFSISGKLPEDLPEAFFRQNSWFRCILNFIFKSHFNVCSGPDSNLVQYSDTMILPIHMKKEEVLEILPAPFRLPDEEKNEFEIFMKISSFRKIQTTLLSKKISSFLPDTGLVEIFMPAVLTTDQDFYQGYFRFPVSEERLFPGRIRKKISIHNRWIQLCILNRKQKLRLNLKTEPLRPFSSGDNLPDFMKENAVIFEYNKENLNLLIQGRKQKIPVNKIHHVSIHSLHPSAKLSGFISGLLNLNYGHENTEGYYIENIYDHTILEKVIPLTASHYRPRKKRFKDRKKRSELQLSS